jgi:hypothetical protein
MSARPEDVIADALHMPRYWRDNVRFKRPSAILAALAAAGHVIEQGWQPIGTAPKDGTQVLVYARVLHPEKWGIYLDPKICAASYHPDAGWCVCEARDATHWRPLPAPPEGQP